MKLPVLAATGAVAAIGVLWLGNALPATPGFLVGGGNTPSIRGTPPNPYDGPLLRDYAEYRDARLGNDVGTLAALAAKDDSFLAYRSALALARLPDADPALRFEYYRRAAELRVWDPLARQENRQFRIELAAVAEAAGLVGEAIEAYAQALPHEVAVAALARLEDDPYRLSNHYFGAGLYREALDALDGRAAPSIEAPSHRRLGNHAEALDAYERWLAEQPDNEDALYGRAWSHFYLGNLEEARAHFARLAGGSSLYARALIERRQGNLDEAVALIRRTGNASWLWLASSWLEAQSRYADLVPIYLEIAAGDSVYADDSAYRALVLAERLGDTASAERARELLPPGSFFALREGNPPSGPSVDDLPVVTLEVQALATELARAGDLEAAIGELTFALRAAQDEATAITLAETLQAFGEFRQSQRSAQAFIDSGSRQLRTWKVAYPRAYPELVVREAHRNGLEPELVWAIMRQESAFFPQAVSVSNAAGLMQVIPSTWNWLAELQKEEPGDRFDPADNIRYGTFYLRWLMDYHDGDAELVIPSYNRGQGYIRRLFESDYVAGDKDEFFREIDALETREYLQRVSVNYHIYRMLYGEGEVAARVPATRPQEIR